MEINRATIKEQARQLIKGNVLQLFIISLVVGILTGTLAAGASAASSGFNSANNDEYSYSYSGDIDSFEDFGDVLENLPQQSSPIKGATVSFGSGISGIISLICAPLSITLAAVYLSLIRGRKMELGESFSYVFKTAFDGKYLNRFLTQLLKTVFSFLWALLFIIPGIIYGYKVYFTDYILADNPNLTWREALALSKKITKGHKGELFVFDLSFIPWFLLIIVTLGIASIYVTPYIMTAKALLFENFKARGLQLGELAADDFVSAEERMNAGIQFGGVYQNPNPAQYQPPQQAYMPYQQAPQQDYSRYQAPQESAPYQAPQPEAPQYYQSAQPEAPQYYQPPQAEIPQEENNYYQPPQE